MRYISEFKNLITSTVYSIISNYTGITYVFEKQMANIISELFVNNSIIGVKEQQEFINTYIDYAEQVTLNPDNYDNLPKQYKDFDKYLGGL